MRRGRDCLLFARGREMNWMGLVFLVDATLENRYAHDESAEEARVPLDPQRKLQLSTDRKQFVVSKMKTSLTYYL